MKKNQLITEKLEKNIKIFNTSVLRNYFLYNGDLKEKAINLNRNLEKLHDEK